MRIRQNISDVGEFLTVPGAPAGVELRSDQEHEFGAFILLKTGGFDCFGSGNVVG